MSTKNKILFNLNTFQITGNIVPLLNKIAFWQEAGWEVSIFSSAALKKKIDGSSTLDEYVFLELPKTRETRTTAGFIVESLCRNIHSLGFVYRLKKRYSVVYSISSVLDLVLFPYVLRIFDRDLRWVTVFDNTVPFTGTGNKLVRFLNWLFFKISTFLTRKADRVYAISPDLRKYLSKIRFDNKKVLLTGNGVEINLIAKARKNNRYDIDALYIGRINEAKGIYEMLKVLKIVIKEYPKFQLAIMGDGDAITVEKFKGAVKSEGLSENVQFLGYKKGIEKYEILKSSKCFWFLSETEGFPVSLMEAVTSGLKCFVYNLPAYDYYKNSELEKFHQGDYRGLATGVIESFRNNNLKNRNGQALLEVFGWDGIAKLEYLAAVDSLE